MKPIASRRCARSEASEAAAAAKRREVEASAVIE
jgi:hypothetical protein